MTSALENGLYFFTWGRGEAEECVMCHIMLMEVREQLFVSLFVWLVGLFGICFLSRQGFSV